MVNTRISVVMTTHNSAQHVEAGLSSVLGQTYRDYEVLVVDDASSDETCLKVEQALRGRCEHRLIRLAQNCGGPAEPRNVGIRQAAGEWVALLDADDLWHPQKLEIQVQTASQFGARFVSSEKRWFRTPAETEASSREVHSLTGHAVRRVNQRQLQRKNFLCTSSVLTERRLLLEHPFDPNPAYRAVEDYRCWLDIHEAAIDESLQILTPLVCYRVSSGSISASKAAMAAKHWRLYGDHFRGKPLGTLQRLTSFGSYAISSVYRQIKYRRTRC
jgi:teichuronic acid biosynthesis glycosyltransferase TuaG